MGKKTKALSGASQDAYFRRVLKEQPSLGADARERLVRRLRQEIAQLRLRRAVGGDTQTPPPPPVAREALPPVPASPPFDPLSPNVIVVVRKSGREGALAALGMIESPDDLRLLAREQRLAVGADLSSAAELRAAIVTAAERRIANRMAAAS
jgi:hypothetical protein